MPERSPLAPVHLFPSPATPQPRSSANSTPSARASHGVGSLTGEPINRDAGCATSRATELDKAAPPRSPWTPGESAPIVATRGLGFGGGDDRLTRLCWARRCTYAADVLSGDPSVMKL